MAEYVAKRFAGEEQEFTPELARLVYQRTDGNALFMVTLVNDLVEQCVIVRRDKRWELAGRLADRETMIPSSLGNSLSISLTG